MLHSLPFLIDFTFNLSLVEEYAVFDMKRVENMLKLVLSADLLPIPKLSFMSLQPACLLTPIRGISPVSEKPTSDAAVRRGRDAPFPAPIRRRRAGSSVSENPVLQRRYSRAVPTVVVTPPPREEINRDDDEVHEEPPARGRSLVRETRPVVISSSNFLSRRESLLRIPQFPAPRRSTEQAEVRKGYHNSSDGQDRPTSRRLSSIPPPLNLPPGYIQRMDEDSDYDVGLSDTADIRPEPELLQARKQSLTRSRSRRPAPLLSGGYF